MSSPLNCAEHYNDEDSYIACVLGARHLPLTTIVPISVVYACIFVVGILGNVCTCLVIKGNKYMQTPTNVYLANLAVSDLLTHLVGEFYLGLRNGHGMNTMFRMVVRAHRPFAEEPY